MEDLDVPCTSKMMTSISKQPTVENIEDKKVRDRNSNPNSNSESNPKSNPMSISKSKSKPENKKNIKTFNLKGCLDSIRKTYL